LLQPINNARTLPGPGFQTLNARFQDLDLRPSVFGSQDQGFRTSKALHPTVVLFFPGHFSLRPPSLFFFPSLFSASSGHRKTDARTDGRSEFIYKIVARMVRSVTASLHFSFIILDSRQRFGRHDLCLLQISTWNVLERHISSWNV
jgi:hypothetical protein